MSSQKVLQDLRRLANDQSTTSFERAAAKRAIAAIESKAVSEQNDIPLTASAYHQDDITVSGYEMPPLIRCDSTDPVYQQHRLFLKQFHVRLIGFEYAMVDECGRHGPSKYSRQWSDAQRSEGHWWSYRDNPHPVYDKYTIETYDNNPGTMRFVSRDEFRINNYSSQGIGKIEVYPGGAPNTRWDSIQQPHIEIWKRDNLLDYREGPWWDRLEQLFHKWSAEADAYDIIWRQEQSAKQKAEKQAVDDVYTRYVKGIR